MFSITANLVLEHQHFTAHDVVLRADGVVHCEKCARTWMIAAKERPTVLAQLARKLGTSIVPAECGRTPSSFPEAAE